MEPLHLTIEGMTCEHCVRAAAREAIALDPFQTRALELQRRVGV